jgi:hypothetical protein
MMEKPVHRTPQGNRHSEMAIAPPVPGSFREWRNPVQGLASRHLLFRCVHCLVDLVKALNGEQLLVN